MTAPDHLLFGEFQLDAENRRLNRDGVPVELSARYLDALILLVRHPGALVLKERFMDEVWRGVPVTDEALTQCIRTLRKQLGDDAGSPRFIETVPKHGYRFIAAVEEAAPLDAEQPQSTRAAEPWRRRLLLTGAGTVGAALAGIIAGILYGSIVASQSSPDAPGGASVLLLCIWLTTAIAVMGGAGVSFGIAVTDRLPSRMWQIAGAGIGGMIVGGSVKLLGVDAFALLLGRSPGDITGAPEGLVLGSAVGLGGWLAAHPRLRQRWAQMLVAGACGGVGALLVLASGGRLMGGSLASLASSFPGSSIRFDGLAHVFGESGFGPFAQGITGFCEGALFAAGVVWGMSKARDSLG